MLLFAVIDLVHVLMSSARNSGGPIADQLRFWSGSGLVKPVGQRPNVYVNRESDKLIVVRKPANKMVTTHMAELVERRGLTIRNDVTCRT